MENAPEGKKKWKIPGACFPVNGIPFRFAVRSCFPPDYTISAFSMTTGSTGTSS